MALDLPSWEHVGNTATDRRKHTWASSDGSSSVSAGAIAKAILPGDDPGGIIVTMLIGIVGAIVGGIIASALNIGDPGDFFDIGTWIIAIVGALLLLVAYRAVSGRRTAP